MGKDLIAAIKKIDPDNKIFSKKTPISLTRKERKLFISKLIETDPQIKNIFDLQEFGFTRMDCLEIALITYGEFLNETGKLFPSIRKRFQNKNKLLE